MVSQSSSVGYTIMGKTADLTVVQKTTIDTLHKEGKTQKVIAKEAGCSQSSVSKHINREAKGRKRCGRKKCTSNRDNRTLERIVKQNPFKNVGEIHKEWTAAGVLQEPLRTDVCKTWVSAAVHSFRFRRCVVQSTLGMAPLNLCFNILFYVFLLSLLTRITSALFIYDRRTLLDIGHHCTNLLQDTLSTDPAWPLEILRTTEVNKGRLNNPGRRRKHRGRRAGIRNRLRKRAHSPPLPSILLANVQSLDNKMDDLRARISFQRDIRDCNILCLTETWLTPSVPDNAVNAV